jgi:hypothetical protein
MVNEAYFAAGLPLPNAEPGVAHQEHELSRCCLDGLHVRDVIAVGASGFAALSRAFPLACSATSCTNGGRVFILRRGTARADESPTTPEAGLRHFQVLPDRETDRPKSVSLDTLRRSHGRLPRSTAFRCQS